MTSTCSCERGVMGKPKEQACWVTRMGEKEAGTEPDRETNEKQTVYCSATPAKEDYSHRERSTL